VECDEVSWRNAGFDRLDLNGTVAACEALFAPWLKGHRLMSNARHLASPWSTFVRVLNEKWFHENIVLVGDAAHTAHFRSDRAPSSPWRMRSCWRVCWPAAVPLAGAFAAYQEERMTEALRLQNAARNSTEWFEHVKRYISMDPEQFTYSLLTRSQRVSHENLRLRDAGYLGGVERWFAARTGSHAAAPPPMFTPFTLRGMTVVNRVVVAPMDMYSAEDGTPESFTWCIWARARFGGAGLVFTEMACVAADARITPGCAGMYEAGHVDAWRRIVDFVHERVARRCACSSATPGRRVRPKCRGSAKTCRSTRATGRCRAVGGAVRAAVAGAA
jgi:anthraniloyl-CoA monooxygenase